jgi:hypothetical protein
MTSKRIFVLLIMLWITILMIWVVNSFTARITDSINNTKSVIVQGIPGQPVPQQFSTVQIDKDTVWLIDANNNYIRVINHDKDGFHLTGSQMTQNP